MAECPSCGSSNYKEYPQKFKLDNGTILTYDLFVCYDCPSYEARDYKTQKSV